MAVFIRVGIVAELVMVVGGYPPIALLQANLK
jgi:hypothetical protein